MASAPKKAPPNFYCAMCPQTFKSKLELSTHRAKHVEAEPAQVKCDICNWPFNDSLALETHMIENSHFAKKLPCDDCGETFNSELKLKEHQKSPLGCQQAVKPVTCDRCEIKFENHRAYKAHRSFPNGPCADFKRQTPPKSRPIAQSKPASPRDGIPGNGDLPVKMVTAAEWDGKSQILNQSDGGVHCQKCKETFASQGRYQAHVLRCLTKFAVVDKPAEVLKSLPSPSPSPTKKPKAKNKKNVTEPLPPSKEPPPIQLESPVNTPPASRPTSSLAGRAAFACTVKGCEKAFNSEAALKVHKTDVHGVGGQRLNLQGKDSWMLNQRSREELKAQGLLQAQTTSHSRSAANGRPPPNAGRGPPQGGQALSYRGRDFSPLSSKPQQAPSARPSEGPKALQVPNERPFQAQFPRVISLNTPVQGPTTPSHGGAAEMEQARNVRDKSIRLLIQTDIVIRNNGKITVSGIDWTRIGVEKQQSELVGMFEKLCHLPKALQGEFLPSPKIYQGKSKMSPQKSEFKPSPPRDRSAPGLGLVALACARIVLKNGCEEAVKIAAVDLSTCRILMCHFVCTDAFAEVTDWRTKETGLSSWNGIEEARLSGYKVLKGWEATRASLWKFIDKETLIVGHNLRAALDSLRMVHGRGVDVAKVAEKAAKGPLSKVQLGLDSLCCSFSSIQLKTEPKYGRNTLQDAFGAREMGLWILKNGEKFDKGIQQKSKEFEALMPKRPTVG